MGDMEGTGERRESNSGEARGAEAGVEKSAPRGRHVLKEATRVLALKLYCQLPACNKKWSQSWDRRDPKSSFVKSEDPSKAEVEGSSLQESVYGEG